MYVLSRDGGYGRNFWKYVDNGTVNIHARNEYLCATIRNGMIVKLVNWDNDESTALTYGEGLTKKKANKTVEQVYYEPNTLQAIKRGGLWKRETGIKLYGSEGTVESYSTSSGAFGREVFTYKNGNVGYVAARWRKKLVVKRPNGKLWIAIEGKVLLGYQPVAERLTAEDRNIPYWDLMRGTSWRMTVYDKDGKTVVTQGQVKNHQKQDKWLEAGKNAYYLSGIKVSQQLFEEDPDSWDASEVLNIPNAQLRCSLLNRMGYDKLLGKVKHRVIDESSDGGQLIEINTNVDEHSSGSPEKVMRLIKVICPSTGQVYVLRVPPGIKNYEQARQWTFGLQEQSINEGAQFELVKET